MDPEENNTVLGRDLDENKLKDIISKLKRKSSENSKLRIKYADDPKKFADSETDLFAHLDELQNVATQSELYHILLSGNILSTLLTLISHENTDISAKTITLFQELVDCDDSDVTDGLIENLISSDMADLLVDNLRRFDFHVKEEADAINGSIEIIEKMIPLDSLTHLGSTYGRNFITYTLKHIKKNLSFNNIKLSMIGLLNDILFDGEFLDFFYELKGTGVMLKQVAYYRKHAPTTESENEYLLQVLSCLCTSISDEDSNQKEFLFNDEGIELIELVLREKGEAAKKSTLKAGILRLLNHVLTSSDSHDKMVKECCQRFIEVLGLKSLFPIFHKPKVIVPERLKPAQVDELINDIEEHTVSIILSLMKYVQKTELMQRVLVKFAEANFEKFERLIRLHDKYYKVFHESELKGHPDADHADHAGFNLNTVDYLILLVIYLSNQYESYDPNSGEKFANYLEKLIAERPDWREQILVESRKLIDEVKADAQEETNSLRLVLEYFETFGNNKERLSSS